MAKEIRAEYANVSSHNDDLGALVGKHKRIKRKDIGNIVTKCDMMQAALKELRRACDGVMRERNHIHAQEMKNRAAKCARGGNVMR